MPFTKAQPKQAYLKIGVYGPQGSGKAQPVDEPVLTPHGFIPIGSIKVGDQVIGRDGMRATVRGVYPQGEKDIFRVAFSDNTETRCCDEHLWTVRRTFGDDRWHVVPLKELRMLMQDLHGTRWGRCNKRWRVPVADEVEFAQQAPLPFDPYVLGCLLGDGCFRAPGVTISTSDPDLIERMVSRDQTLEYRKCKSSDYDYYIRNCVGRIKKLGLHGSDSSTKFIPAEYLTADKESRMELLRGICDTDGHRNIGYVDVTLKSERLADGVAFLARSLGYRCSVRHRKAPKKYRIAALHGAGMSAAEIADEVGSTVDSVHTTVSHMRGKPQMENPHNGYRRVIISCDNTNELFTLSRKRGETRKMKCRAANTKVIKSIDPCGRAECVCISVDSDDSTYLTRDFIVTHNTFTSLLWAEGLARAANKRVAYVDTERGTDFYAKHIGERHLHPEPFDFDPSYTQSLATAIQDIESLDASAYGVIVVDSITHLWDAAIAAYEGKQTSQGGIPLQAWGKIKRPYKRLIRLLLDCPAHVIICGRQKNIFEDDGDSLKKVGVGMRAEGETEYEPHICIRMERSADKSSPDVLAVCEKDRSGILQSKVFKNPSFATIEPILKYLGGEQAKSEDEDERIAADADLMDDTEKKKQQADKSRGLFADFNGRIVACKTTADLAKIADEIKKQKRYLLDEHKGALRVTYEQKRKELVDAESPEHVA